MANRIISKDFAAMATPWRRRRMCVIEGEAPAPAALSSVTGRGARIETEASARRGARVKLRHPVAGAIEATVSEVRRGGMTLDFEPGPAAIAFALAAIAADMTGE